MGTTDIFIKFPYLVKYIYEPPNQPQLSKILQFRSVFVMKAWNLKRNIRKYFRKEIIEEIFLKIY